ncbi:MAG: pyruvate kinase [Candidatus Methylacidiphilales bacterium]
MIRVRKTKIISTLGPATDSPAMLRALARAGVNIFRLNMSHANHDWVRTTVTHIRAIEKECCLTLGILMDTQGPSIRTGDLSSKLELKAGDSFTFTVRGHVSEEIRSVDTNYDDLVNDIHVGDVVLVDNGVIHMVVREKNDRELRCEVLTSGTLGSRRHINLPGIKVNLPALTEKDLEDVHVGVETGVNYIALSFVREANDMQVLRQIVDSLGAADRIRLVAKIEDQSAVRNIREIIDAADAVMVARGDLGIEVPFEELPIIQRKIVKKCVAARKPVIVATHMLESMIENPLPTRAEITDVANAVFEEADCIMLSGETTVGKYPVKCVEILDKVARRIERSGTIGFHEDILLGDDRNKVASSAVHLADQVHADGLVVFTRAGRSAALCAALRPRWSRIFAFTPDADIAGRLTLNYGVQPEVIPFSEDPEENIKMAEATLLEKNILPLGASLVVLSDIREGGKFFYAVQLRRLGAGEAGRCDFND